MGNMTIEDKTKTLKNVTKGEFKKPNPVYGRLKAFEKRMDTVDADLAQIKETLSAQEEVNGVLIGAVNEMSSYIDELASAVDDLASAFLAIIGESEEDVDEEEFDPEERDNLLNDLDEDDTEGDGDKLTYE